MEGRGVEGTGRMEGARREGARVRVEAWGREGIARPAWFGGGERELRTPAREVRESKRALGTGVRREFLKRGVGEGVWGSG